jgi:mannose-1-phosphate guanylyltransferase
MRPSGDLPRHNIMTTTTINQAVLLVGGLGTRLRPLTYALPKALIPVANLPLIAYEIIPLVRAGVKQIIFAMGYKADLLREYLGDGTDYGTEFVYVEEREKLDTAGAIKNVAEYLTGDFFCCNGDMIYDVDLCAFAADHLRREALVTYCLRRTEDIQHFGLIQWEDDGRVTAFREKVAVDETGRNTVNSGFYLMSPEVLEHIPAGVPYSSEQQLFPGLLTRGLPLYAHVPEKDGYWADVGRFDTYLQANGDVLEGNISWFEPTVCSRLPSRGADRPGRPEDEACASRGADRPGRPDDEACASGTAAPTRERGGFVADSVDIQSNVTLGAGATIGPRVSIGARASIGDEAVIEDSIIWAGSVIGAKARLTRCIIAGGTVPEGTCLTDEVIV